MNNNYNMYGSQPPYPGAPSQGFNQSAQNLYPSIPSFQQPINQQMFSPQPPNASFSGVNNPPTRPYAPPSNSGYPSNPGYPTNPGYPNNPGYPTNPVYQSNVPPNQLHGSNVPHPPQPFQNQSYQNYQLPNQPNYGPGSGPYQNQNPGYGYPSQNSGYQSYPSHGQNYAGNSNWDERNYLKKLFDEIDHNRDGQISVQELHQALKRGQPMFDFDPFTVQYLIQKYDNNRNNEICLQEFQDLFVGLNMQFNEFLDIDRDSSGFIDSRELASAMHRKGFNFSPEIFEYIVSEISRRSGKQGISFDIYVRLAARFEALRNEYNRMPVKNMPLEMFVRSKFF